MKNIFQKSCLILILIFALMTKSYALEVGTHKAINEYIANNSLNGFSLDTYLRSNLGMQAGKTEKFGSNAVWEWLRDGGEYEDVPAWYLPYLRSVNHFHNPITKQGFSGIWGTGILSGESSLLWAQKPKGMQSPGGYYSWHDVRDYYYKALTFNIKTERDTFFAQTFRGLGQLMHLVQDLSVPAHARNDGHGPCWLSYNYECWVEAHSEMISASTSTFFDLSVLGQPNPLASVPIANLFDTNKYNGTNPEITISKNIGLSEYTNTNFASDDTIFKNFPYPKYSSGSYEMYDVDYSPTKKRIYLRKKGDGEPIEHFATAGPFYKYLSFNPELQKNELKLDGKCHQDYAQKLIPRAVGYSAGLLDYFFRGKMDMIKDPNNPNQYIIKNLSNENMFGTFSLYYDDTNNNRYLAASWENLAINANSQSSPVTFTAPSSPAPKEKGKYILVFQGTFGNEIGAVGGKVVEGLCAGQWVQIGGCWHMWGDHMGNMCFSYSETIDGKYKYGCVSRYGSDCWTEDKCVDSDGNCRTRAWCDEHGKTVPPCEDECCNCNDYNCDGIMSNVTQSPCYHAPLNDQYGPCFIRSATVYEWQCQ